MEEIKGIKLQEKVTVTKLISAFYYEVPQNFKYSGESHEGWEFVYVERGKICATAGESEYILRSGEMVCHKPMEFHRLSPYQGAAEVIIFCFECGDDIMQYFNDKIVTITPRQKQYLNDIAAEAGKLLLPKSPLDIVRDGAMELNPTATPENSQYIKNTIELLILSLMSAQSTERHKRVESLRQYHHRQTLTADIIQFLGEHLSETVTIEMLSAKFSYSVSSIKRIFKAETGCSVIEYFNEMKLKKAKELLKEKEMSVSEIASFLGFSNVGYFSNMFRKHTGVRPTAYRGR